MPHQTGKSTSRVVLVLGGAEGFPEWIIDHLSSEAGLSSASPEQFMIELEEKLSSGELTLSEIHDIVSDMFQQREMNRRSRT